MAGADASASHDLGRKRSSSFPFIPPDLSENGELMKTKSYMGLQPSSFPLTIHSQSESLASAELNRPDLTLFLCGRRGTTKSLAAKAILGRPPSNMSEWVKHQGETCGRWVSLLELPALCGKPQQVVLEESFHLLSCCDPKGVQAFILVLPLGPLTDEDKGELKTIQDTFSSLVNDFTMVLFTVESAPTAPAVVNFVKTNKDIQDLCQSCGGRYFVLNIEDKLQISEMLHSVEKMSGDGSRCFTKDMFTHAQISKVVEQEKIITRLRAELNSSVAEDGNQSSESLRVVLVGKTGSGKGSTANTILGKKHFTPRIIPKPPSTSCEEAAGEIAGRPVTVVNTPGLFDTTTVELQRSVSMLAPGPHVFLLVLQIGNFTQEEEDSMDMIKMVFGEKAVDFTIIAFTRGEELEEQTIESYIENFDFVKHLVEDCRGKFQVFNNKDETRQTQVRELLTKIENMLKENGSNYYKTEMSDDKEAFKRRDPDMMRITKKNAEEMRRKEAEMESLRRQIKYEREKRAKQEQWFQKEREDRAKEKQEERKQRMIQEEARRQDWRRKLEALEHRVKSERDEKERAERNLEQCRKDRKRDKEAWEREKKEYLAKNRNWRM